MYEKRFTKTGMITQEMLEEYGRNSIVFTKTNQQALDGDNLLDVWTLSFEQIDT